MRILDIRLLAFGPFTGLSLDLSGGKYGFHIIYGPNEAGKSASLRGFTALFCGIPVRTADNFLHDNQSLRLGARLQNSAGEEFSFMRRKGSKDTLLDPEGKPIPEALLSKFLNGAGEDLFTTMFAIDHESLIRGGEQILKGGGVVGESLFAAGMGGTNLRDVLRSFEDEASSLFRPQGKLQKINKALISFKEARQKSRDASLSSGDWAEHDKALREAVSRKSRVDIELKKLQGEKNRLERLRKALPLVAERKELIGKLDALGKVKILSPSFAKKRRDACARLIHCRERERTAAETLTRIIRKMEGIAIPEALLKEAELVTDLHGQLGSHRKAFKDLSRLQGEKLQLEASAESILGELRPDISLEQVEILRITAARRARIRELGSKYQVLEGKLQTNTQELRNLTLKLEAKKEEQKTMKARRDSGNLRVAISRVQKRGELEEELKTALSTLRAGQKQLDIEIKRLALWKGAPEEIETPPVPSYETIDRFESGFDIVEKRLQVLGDRIQQSESSRADVERNMHELRLSGQVPSEDELEAARRRRDKGWALVRASWLEGHEEPEEVDAFSSGNSLPIAYERSVAEADQLADRLRREADRVARQAALVAQFKKCGDDLGAHEKQRNEALEELGKLEQDWLDIWKPAGISPLSPKEMRSWTARLERLAKLAGELRVGKSRIETFKQRIEEHRAELTACMNELGEEGAAGPDESLDTFINRCLHVAAEIEDQDRKSRDLQKTIAQFAEDISRAERERDAAAAELIAWRGEWLQVTRDLGLDEKALPVEANTVLDRTEDLFKIVDKLVGLSNRIAGILRDGERFENAVRGLTDRLAPELCGVPAEQAALDLIERLRKAGEDAAAMAELQEQRTAQESILNQARTGMTEAEAQLRELCSEASCSDHSELEDREERSLQAQVLRKDINALEKQLIDYSGSSSLDDFTREVEGIDADSLPIQLDAIREDLEVFERERSELLERIGREKNQLQMMDGSAAATEAAERAQEILAEIRDNAERYMRLRLASAILHREIERYRAENQDPILRRSGELFSRLTLGSFALLQADFNDMDEPVLLGMRPEGQRVTVEGMSEGTRDQLFLSLRVASIEKYLARNEPLPLIVDDILINFDDKRAEATLKLLDELSFKTQIIFFTHHAHLVDLAKQAVSAESLHLHSLAP